MLLTVLLTLALELQEASPEISSSQAHAAIWHGPFSANSFFPEHFVGPDLTARYIGDDYGWPVWAVAAKLACPNPETLDRSSACEPEERDWVIRQAAAPEIQEGARPRRNGFAFSQQMQVGLQANSDVNTVARDAGLIWREARMSACPVAQEAFDAFRNVSWLPTNHPLVYTSDELNLVLHADKIQLTLQTYLQETTFTGWLAEGNPADRFNAFVVALEPCWTTPSVPAPWEETDAD